MKRTESHLYLLSTQMSFKMTKPVIWILHPEKTQISLGIHQFCPFKYEPLYNMRKPAFSICENKDADQLRSYCAADQRLCFCIRIVQSLFFLNLKFQASSHLQWLYSPVCVRPGQKPRRPVFSQRGSYHFNRSDCEGSHSEVLQG